MANLIPVSRLDDVIALEQGDPIIGARLGMSNKQAQQLLNRLTYLKEAMENKISDNRQDIDASIQDLHDDNSAFQARINTLVTRTDVVDVVGTYSDLQNYDTSSLGLNDIVKVLDDENYSNRCSYYKWNGISFTFVGVVKSSEPILISSSTSDSPIGDVTYVITSNCTLTITSGAGTFSGLSLKVMSTVQNGVLNINGGNITVPQNGILKYRYTGTSWNLEKPVILNTVYPVGSIYISGSNDSDPNTFIGGTWTKLSAGYVLLTAGDNYSVGNTYGSDTVTYTAEGVIGEHTLTNAECPQHIHLEATATPSSIDSTTHRHYITVPASSAKCYNAGSYNAVQNTTNPTSGNDSGHTHTFSDVTVSEVGTGGPHNHTFTGNSINVSVTQTFVRYYIWIRTL